MTTHRYTVVVPTIGRPSLLTLLTALDEGSGPVPDEVLVVDDRADSTEALDLPELSLKLRLVTSGGRGPAAARNVGWRAAVAPWIAFLDDDVVPSATWRADLQADLERAGSRAASSGRVEVPLPDGRRPTDWQRRTAGLVGARWITADLAYRRRVLEEVGGFDERFPRAFREDADLALRVLALGHRIAQGQRVVQHPVPPQPRLASLAAQRGNSDDALMRRLHGRGWYEAAGAPRGRIARHLVITSAMAGALVAALSRRRTATTLAALVAATGVGEFAANRIRRGPIDAAEVGEMLLTSILIPPAAVAHRLRGEWRHRHVEPWRRLPDAVLFDRDGTLVEDVPYNDDPTLVTPVAGAREALSRLRSAGVPVGLITNQSGVASGRITPDRLAAVNARVSGLLGPFGTVQVCVHHRDECCGCRKPEPGLVLAACAELHALPARTVVIGDIGSDMGAAINAGARGILVPTTATRQEELRGHPTAPDLGTAVDRVLAGAW